MLDKLSDAELIQREAIGATEGQYHKRALKWKGLDLIDFESHREQFRNLLRNQILMTEVKRFQHLEAEAGYRCAITLESNSEVLAESDLCDVLSSITSQYFLIDALHLCGLAVHALRSDAAAINPWMVHVAATAPLTPVLSTAALRAVAGTGTYAKLNVGDGDSSVVNAVCALVVNADHAKALKPFLTSPLYEILHTHNACGNADIIDSNAHPALLSATVCHLLHRRHQGARMQDWLDAALLTLRELYSERFVGQKRSYTAILFDHPEFALVTASPELRTKCECTSKPIALALAFENINPLTSSTRAVIAERVAAEWVGRVIGPYRLIREWFELQAPRLKMVDNESDIELAEELVLEHICKQGVDKFFTAKKLRKRLPTELLERYVQIEHSGINVMSEPLKLDVYDGAVTLRTVEQFVRIMIRNPSWELGKKEMFRFLLHAVKHPSSRERARNSILSYEESVTEVELTLKREKQLKYIRRRLST